MAASSAEEAARLKAELATSADVAARLRGETEAAVAAAAKEVTRWKAEHEKLVAASTEETARLKAASAQEAARLKAENDAIIVAAARLKAKYQKAEAKTDHSTAETEAKDSTAKGNSARPKLVKPKMAAAAESRSPQSEQQSAEPSIERKVAEKGPPRREAERKTSTAAKTAPVAVEVADFPFLDLEEAQVASEDDTSANGPQQSRIADIGGKLRQFVSGVAKKLPDRPKPPAVDASRPKPSPTSPQRTQNWSSERKRAKRLDDGASGQPKGASSETSFCGSTDEACPVLFFDEF